ncbi:hypothetical protein FB451DRAFT_1173223 [Mycena latifolia]|nr:hypothetical protein FB451DRAFT_1173223 [Mycena latifolia]
MRFDGDVEYRQATLRVTSLLWIDQRVSVLEVGNPWASLIFTIKTSRVSGVAPDVLDAPTCLIWGVGTLWEFIRDKEIARLLRATPSPVAIIPVSRIQGQRDAEDRKGCPSLFYILSKMDQLDVTRDFAAALPLRQFLRQFAAVNFATLAERALNAPPSPHLPWHSIP